jgi:hypothetical protein
VRDQTKEQRFIDPDSDSISEQGTVVETPDAVTRQSYGNLQYAGCGKVYPAESGKLVASFVWTSDIFLDDLEMVDIVPEPNSRSGLVETIFSLNGSGRSVLVPSHYAERRKHLASNHSRPCQIETQFKEGNTNHSSRNDPTPTPPTTPIYCDDFDAFIAWAQGLPMP